MSVPAKVVLVRRVMATPVQVFDACTRPELLAKWLGPAAFEICEVEADVRVGGRFAFRMNDGGGMLGAQGIYKEIVPNARIVLSWQWIEGTEENRADGIVSEVTIEVIPRADGATITLTHAGLPADQAEDHTNGWNEALDKLGALLGQSEA